MAEKLTIWGRNSSSNVQAVMWAVAELGLDHVRHDVGGAFGKTDTAEYRAMNPNGLVPVLQDGDLSMFESHAIVRYLASRYGNNQLWSADIAEHAHQDMWMEWAKTTIYPHLIAGVFWTLIRIPKVDRNPKILDAHIAALRAAMGIAEKQLEKHEFLAGEAFSIADIGFGTLLFRYFTLDFERADLPKLRTYYDALCDRPAYRQHAMIDYEFMRVEGA